jgi:hypothetical protein
MNLIALALEEHFGVGWVGLIGHASSPPMAIETGLQHYFASGKILIHNQPYVALPCVAYDANTKSGVGGRGGQFRPEASLRAD